MDLYLLLTEFFQDKKDIEIKIIPRIINIKAIIISFLYPYNLRLKLNISLQKIIIINKIFLGYITKKQKIL